MASPHCVICPEPHVYVSQCYQENNIAGMEYRKSASLLTLMIKC